MDPNETLKQIDAYLHHTTSDIRSGTILDEWVQNLYDWIKKGGFEPDWSKYDWGAGYYRCRKVHHDAGERV